VTLTIVIALGACVLIVVMLAVAFVLPPVDDESFVKASRRTSSPLSPRPEVTIQRSGTMPALKDAPAPRATPETRTKPAENPAQRPVWREIAATSTRWRRKLSHALLHFRAWRRRRGLDAGQAGRVAAGVVVLAVALGYLIAHI
jgi:hypothetical protein